MSRLFPFPSKTLSRATGAALFLVASGVASADHDFLVIGDIGNAGDATNGNRGSVAYTYSMSSHEVTVTNYLEILNLKAAVGDPFSLYDATLMTSHAAGGVTRTGSGTGGDPWVYSAKADFGNKPINGIDLYRALRYVNWLNNGMGIGDTENGQYDLSGGGAPDTTRLLGAGSWLLPSEDEWYKAA